MRDDGPATVLSMLCGERLHEIENALSIALTQSLRFPAKSRPIFIGRHLLGQEQDTSIAPLAVMPQAVEKEIDDLRALVNLAVNNAARYNDEPIRRIADYFLRHCGMQEPELAGTIGTTEKELQQSEDDAMAEADASLAAERQAAAEQQAAASDQRLAAKKTPLTRVLDLRDRQRSDAAATQQFAKLGRRASQVLPTVIGAFQEEAAKRQAREVDESVIAEAMAAAAKTAKAAAKS